MPEFPRVEAKILDAARRLIGGMKNEAINSSFMPVPEQNISDMLSDFMEKKAQIVQREAELKQLYIEKKGIFKSLVRAVKRNLKMLANNYGNDEAKMAHFGWGARRKPTPVRLPGQPRVLEATTQGTDWLELDWKQSKEGGKIKFYVVRRRIEAETKWQDVGVFFKTEAKILNQPRKLDMQYIVVAVNRAGESIPSNTVNVVL
jgi:hypothetical protein